MSNPNQGSLSTLIHQEMREKEEVKTAEVNVFLLFPPSLSPSFLSFLSSFLFFHAFHLLPSSTSKQMAMKNKIRTTNVALKSKVIDLDIKS